MQNQTEKLKALLETTKAITSELDQNEVLNLILQRGKELTQADTGALLLVDKDQKLWTKILIGPHQEDEYRHTIDEGITGWVAKNKEPLLVPDVSSDERYIEYTSETKSELAVPMLYGESLIGVLNVESSKFDAFKESDYEQLTALAGQAVIAIENARLYEELNKQVKTIESLHKVGAGITANIELIPILREIAKGLNEIVKADIPLVYLYDQEKDEFRNVYYGDVSEEWKHCKPRKDGAGVKAIKGKNIVVVQQDEKEGPGISTFAKKKGIKTTIAIPLIFGDVAIGAMYLHFLGEQHYLEDGEKSDLDSFAIRTCTVIKNTMGEIGFYLGSNEKINELKEKISEKIDKEKIAEEIDKLTKADILLVYLYDPEEGELKDIIFAGLSKEWGAKCRPREGGAGRTAINSKGLVTAYENPEESYPKKGLGINPYPKQKGAKTTAAYPLIFEDKTLGVFFMHFLERHEFTEEEKKAIAALGAHAAIALERAKTYQRLRELADVERDVTSNLSLKITAKHIAEAIESIIGGGIPNIFLYDSRKESFDFIACSGEKDEIFVGERSLGKFTPREDGLGARVIEKVKKGEEPDYIIIEDVQNDPKNQNPSPTAKDYGIKTSACFPLKFSNRPLGALYLHFKNTRRFSSDDKLMLSMLTDQMAIAINNADQYETQMRIQREIQERLTPPEETINTNLEIMVAGKPSLADFTDGLCSIEELTELFQRLFPFVDKIIIAPLLSGRSGAGVVKVKPSDIPYAIVKFGERGKISEEANRFDNEVFGKIGLYRITFKMRHCSTPKIGGILYTLIGTSVDKVRSFNEYYRDSSIDVARIKKVIEDLFTDVLGSWFNRRTGEPIDLANWYQKHLGISLQTLRREIFTGELVGYENNALIDFGNCGRFLNPVDYVMNRNFPFDTLFCPIHGDLNGNNILIDHGDYTWLIDFAKTGQGYAFQDFIKLECVIKFELLKTVDVQALCEFEEALLSPERFSDFATMRFPNTYNTDDLEKGFAIIKKLREFARDVLRPQDKSAEEYYVGLLHQTLSTLRRTDVRRQHAFLSASMTCDTLDKMP